MNFVDWFRDLAPDQVFLFALPFFLAAVGLIEHWVRCRRARRSGKLR